MARRTPSPPASSSGGTEPDFLAASWERSRSAGVSVDTPRPDYCADFDTSSRLAQCARPVLEQLDMNISDVALVIALTDSRARLIERIDVTRGMGNMVDGVQFAPGFSYAENTMGTNGVGTVIESGRAASIVGEQHYCERLHPFACTAAPVIEPISGRIEGTLDVTSVAGAWSPLMHTLVTTAAKDIGRRLLADRSRAQQELFDAYLRIDSRAGQRAVFAFSDSVVMANSVAGAVFDTAEQAAIRDHGRFILGGRRRRAVDNVELAPGREVRIRSARIDDRGVGAGIIVVAEFTDSPDDDGPAEPSAPAAAAPVSHNRTRQPAPRAESPESVSPAWTRARKQLRTALRSGEPTIVFGEMGSGRTTLATELMRAEFPGAEVVLVEADEIGELGAGAVPDLCDEESNEVLVVVREIDRVAPEDAAALRDLVAASVATNRVRIVATSNSTSLPHGIVRHFGESVELPPLRTRTEDLAGLCERLLAEIAPGRKVSVSVAALRALTAYDWPGNVDELKQALAHALRARPVGEIRVDDLPCSCRAATSRKNLSPIQIAERDAIITALAEHDGNRVAAAEAVGISRSGLYRKMRSYGIGRRI